jgi:hypothetical protein
VQQLAEAAMAVFSTSEEVSKMQQQRKAAAAAAATGAGSGSGSGNGGAESAQFAQSYNNFKLLNQAAIDRTNETGETLLLPSDIEVSLILAHAILAACCCVTLTALSMLLFFSSEPVVTRFNYISLLLHFPSLPRPSSSFIT